jgi:hypothetical protein
MPGSEPTSRGVLTLLDAGAALATPSFQRSFAWRREYIEEYWTDLRRALDADGGPTDYFRGLVVLDDSDEIQDGQ